MKAIVGYTGFVGSNIISFEKFDKMYNSKNISEAYGLKPDILIYSGMPAAKYLANNFPKEDLKLAYEAEKNIKNIAPKKLVLISTVDVIDNPNSKTELDSINSENLQPYGYTRYVLEQMARNYDKDALIVRLPGLFGKNIKKNFIYDMINLIPFMLKDEKFISLSKDDSSLKNYYEKMDNGFYRLRDISSEEKSVLKRKFENLGFTALNFTDSRNVYQFYPLSRLYSDIKTALNHGIKLLHLATEPVSAAELYKKIYKKDFVNEISSSPVFYDFHSVYAEVFGGSGNYIIKKDEIIDSVRKFVNDYEF